MTKGEIWPASCKQLPVACKWIQLDANRYLLELHKPEIEMQSGQKPS